MQVSFTVQSLLHQETKGRAVNLSKTNVHVILAGGFYRGTKCACMCLPARCRSFMTWCRSGMPCPLLYLRWCRGLSLSRSYMNKVTHGNGNLFTRWWPKTCFWPSHNSLSHETILFVVFTLPTYNIISSTISYMVWWC